MRDANLALREIFDEYEPEFDWLHFWTVLEKYPSFVNLLSLRDMLDEGLVVGSLYLSDYVRLDNIVSQKLAEKGAWAA